MRATTTRPARIALGVLLLPTIWACADENPTATGSSTKPQLAVTAVNMTAVTADTIPVGDQIQLSTNIRTKRQRPLVWSSTNTAAVTVTNGGLATGVAAGTSYVIATNGGQRDSISILVSSTGTPSVPPADTTTTPQPPAPAPIKTISVVPGGDTLTVGDSVQLAAIPRDSAGTALTDRTIAWASASPTIATVSSTGKVKAIAAGVANITASAEGKTGTSVITVSAPVVTPVPPVGGSCGLVTDKVAHSEQALAKPGYLQSVIDPAFKTKITRIGGDPGTSIPTVGGTWGQLAKQNYPKDPAWSADQSLIVLKYASGSPQGNWLFLDGNTYQVRFARNSPGVEARWHPTLPDVMVYVTSSGAVGQWNVRTPSTSVKVAPSGYSQAYMGPYEGNLSRDGKWVVVAATRNSDGHKVVYAVDVDAGVKGADIDLAANGVTDLDWASISALGNYIVLNGTIDGVQMSTKVLSRNGGALVSRWPEQARPSHFDMGVDANGVEVGFGGVGSGTDAKYFIMRRLDNGAVTRLLPGSYDYHSSARNVNRPGWAYHVINTASSDGTFSREMFATKLDGSGAVERFGHHRSNLANYDAYPMAVPSPDGKRIMFASNWSTGTAVQAFVIDTRDICP